MSKAGPAQRQHWMARRSAPAHDLRMYQRLLDFAPMWPAHSQLTRGAGVPQRGAALDLEQWRHHLRLLLGDGERPQVSVALTHPERGDEEARCWRPLHGLSYDRHADEIELRVGIGRRSTLRYLIAGPRAAVIEHKPGERILRVLDVSGAQTVIHVRERSRGGGQPQEI
jgi:hypothetical protein